MPRYRFQASGYVEVTAENAQQAIEMETLNYGALGYASKAHTIYDEHTKTFVYVIAVGLPEKTED